MLEKRIEGCCTMVTAIKVLILGKGQVDIFAYRYNIFSFFSEILYSDFC